MKIKKLILIFIGLILLVEVFLRVFISKPSSQQADLELGYTNIPGSQLIESQEGYGFVTFNEIGFNDSNPQKTLSRKIFIVGDSYTEAMHLNEQHGYVNLAEKAISKNSIDLIKLARDSFWPSHYPIITNRYSETYNPELTIIQLGSHTLVDLTASNVKYLLDENGNVNDYQMITSQNEKSKETFRLIINNSALAYFVMRKYKPQIVAILDSFRSLVQAEAQNFTRTKKIRYTEKMYQQRLELILNRIKGKKLVIYLPSPGLLLGKEKSNNFVREIIKQSTQSLSIDFLDYTDIFKNEYALNKQFLNGFANSRPGTGHLNHVGHKVVANGLVVKLKALGYVN